MATYYGFQLVKSPTNEYNYTTGEIIAKNNEVFAANDPLSIESTFLEVAETTDAIVGIALKAQTMTTDNQTVAKVMPNFLPIDQDYEFLAGAAGDLAAADVGKYSVITGTTGAVQVSATTNASPASQDVLITRVDPFGEGGAGAGSGLRVCFVKFINIINLR